MTQFYDFSQNNSGGSFMINDKICHRLFIEADKDGAVKEIFQNRGDENFEF
ncbi:hypothetical protein ABE137_12210 [Brevibacillus laterosporus]|uniref:DUF7296 family protein n=1 Tax=Brevibacillus laterosporus TaxID=1465 RepID=UPI003D1AAB42